MRTYPRRIIGMISTLGLSLAIIFVTGCASTAYPPVSQELRSVKRDYNYLIGPGDSVEIFVWGNEELTVTVPVRPDGKITTRLVEDIKASGKTPSQLARDIEKAYSEFVKSAVVSVIVDGFVGIPTQQIRVVGEASKPLSVPYNKHMTLLDLMIAVGGLTDFADGNKTVLIRHVKGSRETYGLRVEDLLKDGDISANVALWPGDVIIIPEAWF
jgi:polysaccharide biosynthesis/export protein